MMNTQTITGRNKLHWTILFYTLRNQGKSVLCQPFLAHKGIHNKTLRHLQRTPRDITKF